MENTSRYSKGTRVRLLYMDDIQAPPRGTMGTVNYVDDAGTIHVNWENGSTLGLIENEDKFEIVPEVRWFSVEEKLPYEPITEDGYVEPSEYVLVYSDSGRMHVTRYWSHRRFRRDTDEPDWIDLNYPTTETIIAWTPLPEAYRKKGKKE